MRKIPLGLGKYTLVDDADYDWLNQYMWNFDTSGYAQNDVQGSKLCGITVSPISSMHRLILGLELGDKRQADHVNHIPSDNRRCNLRICTCSQNQQNRILRTDTFSQFKGVTWHKPTKKWVARITIKGKRKHLGCFSKEKYAAQAYNLAAKRYYKKFAFLNKI